MKGIPMDFWSKPQQDLLDRSKMLGRWYGSETVEEIGIDYCQDFRGLIVLHFNADDNPVVWIALTPEAELWLMMNAPEGYQLIDLEEEDYAEDVEQWLAGEGEEFTWPLSPA